MDEANEINLEEAASSSPPPLRRSWFLRHAYWILPLGLWLSIGATALIMYLANRDDCNWHLPSSDPCRRIQNHTVCLITKRAVPENCSTLSEATHILLYIFLAPIVLIILAGVAASPLA